MSSYVGEHTTARSPRDGLQQGCGEGHAATPRARKCRYTLSRRRQAGGGAQYGAGEGTSDERVGSGNSIKAWSREDGAPLIAAPHRRCVTTALDPRLEDSASIIAAPHMISEAPILKVKDGPIHPLR